MHEKVCPRFWLLVYHVCIVISLLHVLKLPPPVSVCWWLLCETTTQMFREMINRALDYKQNPSDFMDEVLQELEVQCLFFFLLCVVLHVIWFLLTVQFVTRCVCPAELWPGEEGRWVRRGGGWIESRKSWTAMKREIHQADHLVVVEPKLGPLWKN